MKVSLGIELGEEYFKVVVARQTGVHLKLHDCFVRPIHSLGDDDIGLGVAACLKGTKYKSRSVVVSLPRNSVTVRNLHLPSSDEEEIKKMTGFHITRIVPHKIEDVVSSYCLSGTDEMGYQRITLAIAHKEVIKKQLKILDKAGFLVEKITLSSTCAWQRIIKDCHVQIDPKELYILLDVDAVFTDFIIFEKDNILLTRSISVKAKEIHTDLGLAKLLGGVRQSLLVFQNKEVNKKPRRIFLSGAVVESLAKVIEEELDIPVTYEAPPSFEKGKITVPCPGDPKKVLGADAVISLGAVSHVVLSPEKEKNLSFILPEIEIRKALREKIMKLAVLGSLLIYFLGVICFLFLSRIYNQKIYLSRLQDRYSQIQKNTGDLVQQLEKVEFTKDYLYARQTYMYVLYRLQKIIPANMALNTLRISATGKTTLRGQVFQLADVFDFLSVLEKVKYFEDVQTKYTRKGRWKNQAVTDFEINFQLDVGAKGRE